MIKRRKPNKGNDGSYKVGYGKPPKHTRFKPGKSGNPKGRPKGTNNFETDLKATLKSLVNLTSDGTSRKISTQAAVLLRLKAKALAGDARALEKLLALAQIYSDENPGPVADLSADDQSLLEIFRARVLSGAAGPQDPPK